MKRPVDGDYEISFRSEKLDSVAQTKSAQDSGWPV
jgi:hypothetical protein